MELEISSSNRMDEEERNFGATENGRIRIPKGYREHLQFRLGELIYLRNRSGRIELYQVSEAFEEDEKANAGRAYVTSNTNRRLFLKDRTTGELKSVQNVTLGCDPEAVLVDTSNGRIVPAHTLFKKYGGVGHDGMLIEFRPLPSVYAEEVCLHLWHLIQQARQKLNATEAGRRTIIFACSAYGNENNNVTCGFHLHYGFPTGMLGRKARRIGQLIVRAFDYYVGIPSILPEGNRDVYRRTKKFVDYGKPGGFNLDNRTYEFRMPGGINLVHPVLTRGLLALGATVAEDIVSRINTCTDCFSHMDEMSRPEDLHDLYPNIPSIETFYSLVCNHNIGPARSHLPTIKDDVRKMVGYDKRSAGVESYFNLLDRNVIFNNNVEDNWRAFYERQS